MSRISEIARRSWEEKATPELVREMTKICRTPNGTMTLRPIQAITLFEACENDGKKLGVASWIRTGGGKTITSGLLPFVLVAKNPILFVPAKLLKKTKRELAELRQHWQIPKNLRVESYNKLGQMKHEAMLSTSAIDCIICDEAQMLKHVKSSARARRMAKRMKHYPDTIFCPLTGTPGEVDEYAHLLTWALGEGAPVPHFEDEEEELQVWAGCLNARVDEWQRADPAELVPHLGAEALDFPRMAHRKRLHATPGLIISTDTYMDSKLIVRPRYVDPSPEVEQAFADLRQVWEMPDGWSLADASFEVWHAARKLALGLYIMHDPRPPEPFRDVRKQYCKFVRLVLENSPNYDTELQVRTALEAGQLFSPLYTPAPHLKPAELDEVRKRGLKEMTLFEAWQLMAPTYNPNTFPVWLSEHVVDDCIKWGKIGGGSSEGGIIWCGSIDFAEKLSEKSGWPYFHNMGLDAKGRFIEDKGVKGSEVIIASIDANREGRNLQHKWHRNLIVDPMTKGDDWQQLVSRTHRDGQKRAEVCVDYLVTCYEYYDSLFKAVNSNQADNESIGQSYRLLDADLVMPSLVGRAGKHVWERSDKKNKIRIDIDDDEAA